jgi:hypothetical protein
MILAWELKTDMTAESISDVVFLNSYSMIHPAFYAS